MAQIHDTDTETDESEQELHEESVCETRTRAARNICCWLAFLAIFGIEIWIHVKAGFDKEVFEREENCQFKKKVNECLRWQAFLAIAEIACRTGLAVVFAGMVWELALRLTGCADDSESEDKEPWDWKRVVALAGAMFTMGVGLWGQFGGDEALPFWAAAYSHVADIFCHGIIASAIVGIIFNFFIAAICERKIGEFFVNHLLCSVTLEDHSVASELATGTAEGCSAASSDEENAVFTQKPTSHYIRALFVWIIFAVMLIMCIGGTYYPDDTPKWAGTITDLFGRLCWAGIAWWLISVALGGVDLQAAQSVDMSRLGLGRRALTMSAKLSRARTDGLAGNDGVRQVSAV